MRRVLCCAPAPSKHQRALPNEIVQTHPSSDLADLSYYSSPPPLSVGQPPQAFPLATSYCLLCVWRPLSQHPHSHNHPTSCRRCCRRRSPSSKLNSSLPPTVASPRTNLLSRVEHRTIRGFPSTSSSLSSAAQTTVQRRAERSPPSPDRPRPRDRVNSSSPHLIRLRARLRKSQLTRCKPARPLPTATLVHAPIARGLKTFANRPPALWPCYPHADVAHQFFYLNLDQTSPSTACTISFNARSTTCHSTGCDRRDSIQSWISKSASGTTSDVPPTDILRAGNW